MSGDEIEWMKVAGPLPWVRAHCTHTHTGEGKIGEGKIDCLCAGVGLWTQGEIWALASVWARVGVGVGMGACNVNEVDAIALDVH